MARFFVDPAAIADDQVTLEGADAHHAATVLRLRPGAAVTVLDGQGRELVCVAEVVEKRRLTLRVTRTSHPPPPPVEITLYQGLAKGDKLEWVIQKATELGATRIVPLAAARSIAKLEPARVAGKLARWRAIAREAAEQSERATIPEVSAPVTLAGLTLPPEMLALVLAERATGASLPHALPAAPPRAIALFVGPEGGWDPAELASLASLGAAPVSLGPRILRTETAGLAALAIVMATYELS